MVSHSPVFSSAAAKRSVETIYFRFAGAAPAHVTSARPVAHTGQRGEKVLPRHSGTCVRWAKTPTPGVPDRRQAGAHRCLYCINRVVNGLGQASPRLLPLT